MTQTVRTGAREWEITLHMEDEHPRVILLEASESSFRATQSIADAWFEANLRVYQDHDPTRLPPLAIVIDEVYPHRDGTLERYRWYVRGTERVLPEAQRADDEERDIARAEARIEEGQARWSETGSTRRR